MAVLTVLEKISKKGSRGKSAWRCFSVTHGPALFMYGLEDIMYCFRLRLALSGKLLAGCKTAALSCAV